MEALEAYQLAAQLHTGQVDKAGRPYIEHLTRLVLQGRSRCSARWTRRNVSNNV